MVSGDILNWLTPKNVKIKKIKKIEQSLKF